MRTLARQISILLIAVLIPVSAAFAQEDEADFTRAELDQMLAPIALYPDVLLSQILMAATYPLEVVEAARWSRANPGLEGEEAVEAVADQDWDPSVKALVAFPQVLERMSEDLDWTTRLGDAFLYQEAQVMDIVQGLRQKAHDAGNLDSTGNVRMIRENEVIIIEPVHPRVVYVPYYNPRVIYGPWWWPAYPPYYWAPPPGFFVSTGFFWTSGVHVSLGFFFSTFDWHRHHIVVAHHHHHLHHFPRFRSVKHVHHHHRHHIKRHGHKWRHSPKHRRGIAYRHHSLQREFGRTRASSDHRTWSRTSHRDGSQRFHGPRSGRDTVTRSRQRPSATGRTDDRRTAGQTQSRNLTRSHADRSRSATSLSGTRSGMQFGRSSIGTHSLSGNSAARGSRGAERRSSLDTRRTDTGGATTHSLSRGEGQSRRQPGSDARRAMSQRREAAQGRRGAESRGISHGRIESRRGDASRAAGQGRQAQSNRGGPPRTAGTQSRRSAGDRQANRQSQSSLGNSASRGAATTLTPSAGVNRGATRSFSGQRSRAEGSSAGGDRSRSFSRGRSASLAPGASAGRSTFSDRAPGTSASRR